MAASWSLSMVLNTPFIRIGTQHHVCFRYIMHGDCVYVVYGLVRLKCQVKCSECSSLTRYKLRLKKALPHHHHLTHLVFVWLSFVQLKLP